MNIVNLQEVSFEYLIGPRRSETVNPRYVVWDSRKVEKVTWYESN